MKMIWQCTLTLLGGLLPVVVSIAENLAPPSEEPPLMRLFLEPGQRRQLDFLREHQKEQPEIKEQKPIVIPDYLTLNGVVIRKNGMHTIWLNQKKIEALDQDQDRAKFPGMNIEFDALDESLEVPLQIINGNQLIRLQPGYSYNTLDETMVDGYLKK